MYTLRPTVILSWFGLIDFIKNASFLMTNHYLFYKICVLIMLGKFREKLLSYPIYLAVNSKPGHLISITLKNCR